VRARGKDQRGRRKEESARTKERERQQEAIAKAHVAIEEAKREHDKRASTIEVESRRTGETVEAEDARWEKQKEKLEIALRRARR
jgi:colicin import membrane protein